MKKTGKIETFPTIATMKKHEDGESVHQRNLERIMGEKNVLKPSKTKGK